MMRNEGSVAGATALVTGAASGIGHAVALRLAAEGARVAVVDRDEERARELARAIVDADGLAIAHPLDVTDEAAWQPAVDRIEQELGTLRIAVHSAGISFAKPLTETSLDEWRHVLAVNLDGVFLATRAAVAAMRRSGAANASIINIGSASGLKASPGAAAYCASKAAVIHFTRTVAAECTQCEDTIRVNCVVPGGVKTPMWHGMDDWDEIRASEVWNASPTAPAGKRFAEPDEIARAVLFLASPASSYVTGSALVVDGGYTA